MGYGDILDLSKTELEEMTLLSLSDYEPNETAKIVLEYVLIIYFPKNKMKIYLTRFKKKMENVCIFVGAQTFFTIVELFYKAYNGKYIHPTAVEIVVALK